MTFHVPLGPVNKTRLKFMKMKNEISERVCEAEEWWVKVKMTFWPRNHTVDPENAHNRKSPSLKALRKHLNASTH